MGLRWPHGCAIGDGTCGQTDTSDGARGCFVDGSAAVGDGVLPFVAVVVGNAVADHDQQSALRSGLRFDQVRPVPHRGAETGEPRRGEAEQPTLGEPSPPFLEGLAAEEADVAAAAGEEQVAPVVTDEDRRGPQRHRRTAVPASQASAFEEVSIAPDGEDVVYLACNVPVEPRGGWAEKKDKFRKTVLRSVERYMSGLEAEIGHVASSPADFEAAL